ncbi:MAG: DUF3180 domain-containing protein [Cellulomonadaceae bacterium]|jgi:hypothetical protein|nr:DUF3180 domain-containing protein [Cellulomonadaceae bacterium]
MRRTSLGMLAVVAAAVFLVVLAIMQTFPEVRVGLGNTSWVEWVALFSLSIMILRFGLAVRAYLKGDKPDLDPIKAARTLALAKAAEWTGAILFGRYLAATIVIAQNWGYGIQRLLTVELGIAALAALTLLVCGVIVERFCELPPADIEKATKGGGPGGRVVRPQIPQETPV